MTPSSTEPHRRPALSFGSVLAFYAGLSAVAFVISWLHRGSMPWHLPDGNSTPLWFSLVLGAAVGGVIAAVSALLQRASRVFAELEDALAEQVGRTTRRQAVVFALASGVGEELLFRGALLPWLGMLVSSLLFGALHIGADRRLVLWIPVAFAIGLVFASLSLYTGDVAAAIVAHSLVNFIGFVELARR